MDWDLWPEWPIATQTVQHSLGQEMIPVNIVKELIQGGKNQYVI